MVTVGDYNEVESILGRSYSIPSGTDPRLDRIRQRYSHGLDLPAAAELRTLVESSLERARSSGSAQPLDAKI